MGRRLHAGLVILLLGLTGPGLLRAQSADGEQDNGWFDPEPKPAPEAPASSRAVAPSATGAPTAPQPAPAADDADPRALTDFRPHLDPYGRWLDDPRYGTVWVPHAQSVGTGFAPYVSGGHWELSTTGEWVWASEYPFGWIVFHYGRWVWIAGQGWAWIPGYRYAPAWVVWRVPTGGDAYVGWAPAGPDFVWINGYAVVLYAPPPYYWVFCPSPYVFHAHVHYYIVRDRPLMERLAYSTRYYAPARPRARTPASPTPAAARVPASALPRQRTALRPVLPSSVATPAVSTRRAPAQQRQASSPAPVQRAAVATPKNPTRASPVPAPVERPRSAAPKTPQRASPVPARPKPSTLRPVAPPPLRDSARQNKRQR